METGLLNFHDEETFATSIYDQGDFSGVDGQGSLLDMMHSDLQYSSDYLNQSAVHWDSDQEQEHNGDLAVLPVAPSECSSLNSSREDYNKSLFDWQDNLLPPLDPDGVDLRLDGQVIPSELPENIFEDSFESNSSVMSNLQKSSLSGPLARCSTPNPPCPKETTVSSDASLNLDVSLSALDVNVSDIDVSALGINVSSLDMKNDVLDSEAKCLTPQGMLEQPEVNEMNLAVVAEKDDLPLPGNIPLVPAETSAVEDTEFTALFGPPKGALAFPNSTEATSLLPAFPHLDDSQIPVQKLENADVEQLHDIAMEIIKEDQASQAWDSLPILDAPLDSNDLDVISTDVPVLEAGNLESLLEQFEATLKPTPEFTQSMPASPAHFSVPPSPLSMPASPSCIVPSQVPHTVAPKSSPLPSPIPSPSKTKSDAGTPKKTSPSSKGVSVLHQNILESLPTEIMDRIKASGRKKTIPLIPAMPSKRPSKSSTRMHAAGATLSKNKLLKLVTRKGCPGENIQLDHDYCSNDSSNQVEFVPEKLVMDIKASARQKEVDEDKSSRKDSGLESGEDSEGTAVTSASGVVCDTGGILPKVNANSILKPRASSQPGRNKEMLMVSVLKKVRCDTSKSPAKQVSLLQQKPKEIAKCPPVQHVKPERSSVLKPAELLLKSVKSEVKEPLVKSLVPGKGTDATSLIRPQASVKILPTPPIASVKPPESPVSSEKAQVKNEPPEVVVKCTTPLDTTVAKPENQSFVKAPEQPKKRKLNLEEYRSRLKAMEQKRDNAPSDVPKGDLPAQCDQEPENLPESTKLSLKAEDISKDKVVVKEEKHCEVPSQAPKSTPEAIVKAEKEVVSISNLSTTSPVKTVQEEKNLELCSENVSATQQEMDANPKPVEEKKKQRQYRTRRLSTSSSEESPQKKQVNKPRRKENGRKNAVWSPPRSRSKSKSVSPSSSHSRSASSSSESCCSSSSDSSSSSGSVQSSPKRRKTRQRRRKRASDRSSSRSSSSSSRRSNSISSGSSRHSSRRSSRSRRRSRSRSMRRSRRDRSGSRSTSRGRSRRSMSWRRVRRDSSRSRGSGSLRRERSRSRSRRGGSWSSFDRSRSGSRSRSRSCRRRFTSRSRSRSRARRRFNSYSSRSESRSRSSFRSSRSRSYSSSSRSRTRSRDRKRARLEERSRGRRSVKKSRRSRSPMRRNVDWSRVEKEHNRQVEERRVIYVGRIPEDTTKAEIRRRFEVFGPIVDISLHFREHADNYGFVTFAYKVDAYEAVEHGNDDPTQPPYELCFGGRRKFCRERYADLDGMACNKNSLGIGVPQIRRSSDGNSFDDMLREVQAKLQARKKL